MKAKRAKPSRVYLDESDPRQAKVNPRCSRADCMRPGARVNSYDQWWCDRCWNGITLLDASAELATEFGPWVRGADGRWQRDRRKR